jgi:hypothetical protein
LRSTLRYAAATQRNAVSVADKAANFFRPLRDTAVHFAGAKYGVRRPALASAAVDVTGLRQVDRDTARNTPNRIAQPTMPAIVASFMQFCSDTTQPSGARYCWISVVAQAVS